MPLPAASNENRAHAATRALPRAGARYWANALALHAFPFAAAAAGRVVDSPSARSFPPAPARWQVRGVEGDPCSPARMHPARSRATVTDFNISVRANSGIGGVHGVPSPLRRTISCGQVAARFASLPAIAHA